MTKHLTLEKSLGLLIVLTLLAIAAERPLLKTSFVLDPGTSEGAVYADNNENGNSSAQLLDSQDAQWRCTLRSDHPYPYCGYELLLDPERQHGLDLRHIDTIQLWLDYQGPTDTIRLYLRNYDPVYSRPELRDSTKYNQVEFDADLAREPTEPLTFALKDFFVANWWFQRYRIAPELAHPQFDNIVVIEVQTGIRSQPGEHEFSLQRIELVGQHLSSAQWYQLILGVWLAAGLVFLAVRVISLQRELRQKNLREHELTEINTLLDNRSRLLEEKAKTDPLTGAFNREGLDEAIQRSLQEWRQFHRPLSLIMFDLDHFKYVNDTHGHAAGDRVLSDIAHLVRQHIRQGDAFARWGGEEFILLCPNTHLHEAVRLAEKIRLLIADSKLGPDGDVRASFGVATLRHSESLEQVFSRLDKALYAAKHQGRNRVEVSPAVA